MSDALGGTVQLVSDEAQPTCVLSKPTMSSAKMTRILGLDAASAATAASPRRTTIVTGERRDMLVVSLCQRRR